MDEINYDDNKSVLELIVSRNELPRHIYKYTNFSALKKILKSGKIYFSKPSNFNDPFDCNLTIDTNNTDLEINNYIDEITEKNKLSETDSKKYRTKYLNPTERFELTNTSVKQTKESFGVSCFSRKFDNLIMWAHYADKHRGVVLKFDILEDTDFFMTPVPIQYKAEYPTFNYLRNRDSIGKFLLETKSLDWAYEDEIRIMKHGSGLYKIKKSALVEIIFGCGFTEKNRKRIVRIAKNNKWVNLKFTFAQISLKDFKLNFS